MSGKRNAPDGASMDAELLSLTQAAALSGLSQSRLRRLAAAGRLRARKAGFYWVVSSSALTEFMALERKRGRPKRQSDGEGGGDDK